MFILHRIVGLRREMYEGGGQIIQIQKMEGRDIINLESEEEGLV
ncbi:unnamed protein product [Paramecium sonneborni]|uniref:Uncharacterized protein n=1 Tax=Paramecium sonneborni TaxID=65129 RepID=A0A8S1N317_9CILI|nr:unnamed protein product [Paramecium sonneborni]